MAQSRKSRIALLFLIILVLAAAAGIQFVPIPGLKEAAESRLSLMIGRPVTLKSARLNLIKGPSLILKDVTIEENPDFGSSTFLEADEVRANVQLSDYIRSRKLSFDSLNIASPKINLVKNQNGVWSWTTLGKTVQTSSNPRSQAILLSVLLGLNLEDASFRRININDASVKLIDRSGELPNETDYRGIALDAQTTRTDTGQKIKGTLTIHSQEPEATGSVDAGLPFDIETKAEGEQGFTIAGSLGPGSLETPNLKIASLAATAELAPHPGAELTGRGRLTLSDLFIQTINVSEQVARSLRLDGIGDMNPGSEVASLETGFSLSKGAIRTDGLRIQQIDGLGDATAQTGDFKIEPSLILHYDATIILSADSTARLKSSSSTLGLLVTILETQNRLSVPISIDGDVRNPQIKVDVSRLL